MFNQLSLERFLELSKLGKRVAVFEEIPADHITPLRAYHALSKREGGSVLLETGEKDQDMGKCSFLGLRPIATFKSNTLDELRPLLAKYRCVDCPELPALAGGAIGFATYDAVHTFEKISCRHPDTQDLPNFFFQFFEVMIAFQHMKGTVTFSVVVEIGSDPEAQYKRAKEQIREMKDSILHSHPLPRTPSYKSEPATPDMDDAEYGRMVEKAKEHLKRGEIFQIVLSRRFLKPVSVSALEIYTALRMLNPSPFMFLMEGPEYAIAGASPERLVSLNNGYVETMPIAGSRQRGKGEEDKTLEQDLLSDEKELSEHMMLVDLGRNDVGRISKPGTVVVKELKTIRRFSHIMHMVSKVGGTLKDGLDALDVLKAVFPAGTLSGAPKISAMEIIDKLESSRRGVYGGAICNIDSRGNMDSCIVIRTLFLKDGIAEVRAGAGIVLDSEPQKEADETQHKARAVLEAIRLAEEGIL